MVNLWVKGVCPSKPQSQAQELLILNIKPKEAKAYGRGVELRPSPGVDPDLANQGRQIYYFAPEQ